MTMTHEPPDPPDDPPPGPPRDADDDPSTREQVLSRDTTPEGVEYMGEGYVDLDDYFRRELAEHIDPPIHWILDHLDMTAVRDRFEADQYKYLCESGEVYRVSLTKVQPEVGAQI